MLKTFIVNYETPRGAKRLKIQAKTHKAALRLFNDKLQAEGRLGTIRQYSLIEIENKQMSLF